MKFEGSIWVLADGIILDLAFQLFRLTGRANRFYNPFFEERRGVCQARAYCTYLLAQLAFAIHSFDARDCVMLGTGTLFLKRELLHRQTPWPYSLPCEHDA